MRCATGSDFGFGRARGPAHRLTKERSRDVGRISRRRTGAPARFTLAVVVAVPCGSGVGTGVVGSALQSGSGGGLPFTGSSLVLPLAGVGLLVLGLTVLCLGTSSRGWRCLGWSLVILAVVGAMAASPARAFALGASTNPGCTSSPSGGSTPVTSDTPAAAASDGPASGPASNAGSSVAASQSPDVPPVLAESPFPVLSVLAGIWVLLVVVIRRLTWAADGAGAAPPES